MQPSPKFSPRDNHTVILQPRRLRASPQLHQTHVQHAPGSPGQKQVFSVSPRTALLSHDPSFYGEGDLLVRFGIYSSLGRMVTRILMFLVFFQPVYVAYGMELEEQSAVIEPPTPVVDEVVVVDARDTTDVDTDVDTDPVQTGSEPDDSPVPAEDSEDAGITEGTDDPDTQPQDTDDGVSSPDEPGSIGGGSEEGQDDMTNEDEEIETEDDIESGTESEGSGGGGSNTHDEDEEISEPENETKSSEGGTTGDTNSNETETASTSEEVATTTPETDMLSKDTIVDVVQDASTKYMFGEGDCTLVADGEFYCVAKGPERHITGDPRVYSEKDREGDREIFYFDGAEVHKITNNSYDDFAPVFDEKNLRIVWQAMLNDRLQIMVHEIPTVTTRQVTTTRQNSSNPSIAGDIVVWQEWVDTNWEIMMTDVNNGGQEFEIERLTDNAVHDMFPAVYEGLVTWQREHGDSWEVVVYDLRTEKTHTLEKNEDTKYENPRFVLLFDSRHENGDIETIGYDLDTGEMMELGTKSSPVPVEPVSPKEEAPDALPRESASSTQVKITSREDDAHNDTFE